MFASIVRSHSNATRTKSANSQSRLFSSALFGKHSDRTNVRSSSVAMPTAMQQRYLNLHENQSMAILRKQGVNTPLGFSTDEPNSIPYKMKSLIGPDTDVVVKALILAGGRGKGVFTSGFKGGVHLALSPEDASMIAKKMIGQTLVTKQTGSTGKPCHSVYIQERLYARRELYFGMVLDRDSGGPVIIASRKGGMAIEDVARDDPDAIFKEVIDIKVGPQQEQVERLAKKLGIRHVEAAAEEFTKLYEVFIENDATLLEINPMVETPEHKIVCSDCKLNFDDNASFKHPMLFAMQDLSQEDPRDIKASESGLNYIGLDGNIGCIVNGAGLAMATMDIIQLHGGSPANFLDVGGGANKKQVADALHIIQSDPKVEGILVNIFGGIMRCDVVAAGIIAAAQEISLRVPLVLRLKGTNVEEGKKLVEEANLKVFNTDDLDEAASRIVKMANIVRLGKEAHVEVDFDLDMMS